MAASGEKGPLLQKRRIGTISKKKNGFRRYEGGGCSLEPGREKGAIDGGDLKRGIFLLEEGSFYTISKETQSKEKEEGLRRTFCRSLRRKEKNLHPLLKKKKSQTGKNSLRWACRVNGREEAVVFKPTGKKKKQRWKKEHIGPFFAVKKGGANPFRPIHP